MLKPQLLVLLVPLGPSAPPVTAKAPISASVNYYMKGTNSEEYEWRPVFFHLRRQSFDRYISRYMSPFESRIAALES